MACTCYELIEVYGYPPEAVMCNCEKHSLANKFVTDIM